MAVVTITVSDLGDGEVNFKFDSEPPIVLVDGEPTPAQQAGMFMLNQISTMFSEPQKPSTTESVIQTVDGNHYEIKA